MAKRQNPKTEGKSVISITAEKKLW